MTRHLPQSLQSTLWSVNVKNLDMVKDKGYIINQILAYGSFSDWRWLFKNYSFKTILKTFLERPQKIYRPERFSFAKNILLGLKDKFLVKEYYVVNTPRIIKRATKKDF